MKKQYKLAEGLTKNDEGRPFACDIANVTYEVINHRKGEALKCEFIINPTLQKTRVKVVERTDIPKELI